MRPDDPFRHLEPPPPPDQLRGITLAAAERALAAEARPDPWDRLWRSPAARLAWAAATILLLAGHLVLSLDSVTPRPLIAAPDGELADIAELPPLRFDLEPLSAAFAALADQPPTTPEEPSS